MSEMVDKYIFSDEPSPRYPVLFRMAQFQACCRQQGNGSLMGKEQKGILYLQWPGCKLFLFVFDNKGE